MKIDNVLMSVNDKTGLSSFALGLQKAWFTIFATEWTLKNLEENGLSNCIPVKNITKNPSGFEDCIQSISFNLPAGIVFDRNNHRHVDFMTYQKIPPISLVVYNFPPLTEWILNEKDFNIQHIDVGGPSLVQAAATSFHHVLVIVNPEDYISVLSRINENNVTYDFQKKMALKAFQYIQNYNSLLIEYLKKQN